MSKNNIFKMIFNESLQEHIYQLDEVIKSSLKSVKFFLATIDSFDLQVETHFDLFNLSFEGIM